MSLLWSGPTDQVAECLEDGPLPGNLAGPLSILGHRPHYVVTTFLSGRQMVVIVICGVVLCALLAGSILGEDLVDSLRTRAVKAGPAAFFLGLSVLIIGIMAGTPILDVVGAGLIGAVVLGTIVINY